MQRKRREREEGVKKRQKLSPRAAMARAKGQRNIPVTEFSSSPLATSPPSSSSLYIERNGGMALTVQMFGVGLVRPEGLLVNEGIRAGKVRDRRRVELSI